MRLATLKRQGITTVQICVLLALIVLVAVSALKNLGTNAKTSLNSTAGNVANPSTLPARFGS